MWIEEKVKLMTNEELEKKLAQLQKSWERLCDMGVSFDDCRRLRLIRPYYFCELELDNRKKAEELKEGE